MQHTNTNSTTLHLVCALCLFLLPTGCVRAETALSKAVDGVTHFFMGCDTNYVTPQQYHITAQSELSYWQDYYHLRSRETGNSMTIESEPSLVLGGYVYYGIVGLGLSWNLGDLGKPDGETNGTSMRRSLALHTARLFAEVFTYRSGKSARITNLTNFDFGDHDRSFSGLNSELSGLHAFYIFNNRRFSWPAAFGENAVQRRSQGSFTLGFQYNKQKVTLNARELPAYMNGDIDSTLLFRRIDYSDYSLSIGYAYNWVLGRNLLLAISLQPSVGYRRSNVEEADNSHDVLRNLSTDLITRASFFWNNTKLFSGLILEMHTYSYRRNAIGLTNTYGTLKFVCGFNCMRKRHP